MFPGYFINMNILRQLSVDGSSGSAALLLNFTNYVTFSSIFCCCCQCINNHFSSIKTKSIHFYLWIIEATYFFFGTVIIYGSVIVTKAFVTITLQLKLKTSMEN
jgi:hypothetical protein